MKNPLKGLLIKILFEALLHLMLGVNFGFMVMSAYNGDTFLCLLNAAACGMMHHTLKKLPRLF